MHVSGVIVIECPCVCRDAFVVVLHCLLSVDTNCSYSVVVHPWLHACVDMLSVRARVEWCLHSLHVVLLLCC